MSDAIDLAPVSVEQDGRILTGIGVTPEALEQTMARHAPAEPAAEPEAPASPVVEPPEPPPTRGAKRFDQLTGEREAARREADAAKREAASLKAELDALRRPAPAAEPPTPAATTRAKPTEAEVGGKYDSYADFVEDLADWKAEQRLAAVDFDAQIRGRIEADRASRSHQERLAVTHTRALGVYPDFDAVLAAPHVNAPNWPAEKLAAILALPEPEHIQYALAKDPVLAERLRVEPNLAVFGMELGKLIPAPGVASTASTPPRGPALAPAPYQPVGSGSKTTGTPSADLAKKGFDFDASGYREKRAAERGGFRR